MASNSIAARTRVISLHDRLLSVNEQSMEDISMQKADEIIKAKGKGQWKLVIRQALPNQEKESKEIKQENISQNNEADGKIINKQCMTNVFCL